MDRTIRKTRLTVVAALLLAACLGEAKRLKVLSSNEVAALSSPADVNFCGDVVGSAIPTSNSSPSVGIPNSKRRRS